ncbi:uncharacterized protein LOC135344563 isoform X2 [Halichondria panicea]|uniref:uncharacterized protein LOC135344563 isoform X2 n=1 Tax=Halichondria panicea TaxID=6063 RepID=UPI00312B4EA1
MDTDTSQQDSELDAQKKLAKDLWKAVHNRNVIKVVSLLEQGADPNHQLYWSKEWYTDPPLHKACLRGHLEIMKTLVTHGARTDKGDGTDNMTPLHYACMGGYKEMVKYLTKEVECSTDVRDYEGQSPLDRALEHLYNDNCVDVALYLMSRGCGCDEDKAKLLCGVCRSGKLDVVKELVEQHQVDPKNVKGDKGQSPLDIALGPLYSNERCVDVALYLMSRGCGGDDDKAKLMCGACQTGKLGVVKELVEQHKVDPKSVTNYAGKTPLDLATQRGRTEVTDYLKSLPQQSAVTGDSDSWTMSEENGPPPTKNQNGTPLTEEDSDALEKLLLDNKIKGFALTGERTYQTVVHHLYELGHEELASNLRSNLDKAIKWQHRYIDRLMTLMVDKETIDMCTLKLCLVGPPHVGKTTTLNRLLQVYENIQSAGDKAKHPSTLLANCIQVMALINEDKWISSMDVDEEAKMIFGYLCGKVTLDEIDLPKEEMTKAESSQGLETHSSDKDTTPISPAEENLPHKVNTQTVKQATLTDSKDKAAVDHQNKLAQVILRLQKLIKSGNYSQMAKCLGNTLLNINDVGGQPEFLEMLPALSNGPAMYLVFLDLSKELDKPYDIPFSRDGKVITPYKSMHTVKTAVSQILSSIASVRHMSEISKPLLKTPQLKDKFEAFLTVPPVAALIGTHKDKLGGDSADSLEREIYTRDKMVEINTALKPITKTFENILIFPRQKSDTSNDKRGNCSSDRMSFFALDNDKGTENAEISPLRGLMNNIFYSRFGKTSLPISKNWLVLGIILRKEYKIATVADCIEIGKMLEMDEEETKICLLYLHCIGSILYYTNVPDDDDPCWLLKCHVICLPQVIFDSISQLIIVSMLSVHGGGYDTEFERAELIRKGQFSQEAIERHCKLDVQVTNNLENKLLIPSGPLVKLLKHLNLLSEITHKDKDSERITYLMPAILDCATIDKVSNPPQPDTNNPEPLNITFSFGYVPTGVFCGLITRLVSQGPHGILGLTWELMEEDSVKRNCISFYVDYVHKVTLLSHDRSYEIRVERNAEQIDFSLHDLCSYTLSAIMYSLKILFPKLNLSVAFPCSCPKHAASKSLNNVCTLIQGRKIHFLCGRSPVTLSKGQQVWLGKHVSIGSSTELEVLKFAEGGFLFHWSKEGSRRQIKTTDDQPNTLSFQSVREEDFGHYQCEVKNAAAGKVLFTLYTALYKEETRQRKRSLPSDKEVETLSKRPKEDVTVQVHEHETTASAAQLCQECSDEALLQLSTEIAGYDKYKLRLGLSDADIDAIDQNPATFYNIPGRFYTALKMWKSKGIDLDNPSNSTATYGQLVDIASKIEDREAVRSIHKAAYKTGGHGSVKTTIPMHYSGNT